MNGWSVTPHQWRITTTGMSIVRSIVTAPGTTTDGDSGVGGGLAGRGVDDAGSPAHDARGTTRRGRERGVSTLEFALIIPLLLTMVLGLIEGGRLLNAWAVLTAEAADGARYGAVRFSDPAREPGIAGAVTTYIRGRVGGALDMSALTISVVPTTQSPSTGPSNKWLTVTLTYRHTVYTPLIAELMRSPMTLRASAVMRGE